VIQAPHAFQSIANPEIKQNRFGPSARREAVEKKRRKEQEQHGILKMMVFTSRKVLLFMPML
jgi:hypothetical protein